MFMCSVENDSWEKLGGMMFLAPLLFLVAQHNEEHQHNAQPWPPWWTKSKRQKLSKKTQEGRATWHGAHLKQKIKVENRKMFEGEVFYILVVLLCTTKKMHNARPP